MTVFYDPTGPLLRVEGDTLFIADLNPEMQTRWAMSRWELFCSGMKLAFAGLFGRR